MLLKMSKLSKKLNKKLQMKMLSKTRLLRIRTSEHEFYFAYVIRIINDTNVLQADDVALWKR